LFDEHWAKILADDTSLKQTVEVDGRVAGNVTSFLRDGVREVGYWLDRAYWGRGWRRRRCRLSSSWKKGGRFTQGWPGTTSLRSGSSKNAGSCWWLPRSRHPRAIKIRSSS